MFVYTLLSLWIVSCSAGHLKRIFVMRPSKRSHDCQLPTVSFWLTRPPSLCYDGGVTLERPLGIALLGCGGVASGYRASYADLPGTVFRLAVDVDEAIAEKT